MNKTIVASITFIGEDENNIHVNDSEKLASMVNQENPEYRTFDACPLVLTSKERNPEITETIQCSVQTGDLIVN